MRTHSVMSDSVTSGTAARQDPLSRGSSRQEYWSGLPCPPPGDLHNPGTEHRSPVLQADSLPSEPPGKPYKGYSLGLPCGPGAKTSPSNAGVQV